MPDTWIKLFPSVETRMKLLIGFVLFGILNIVVKDLVAFKIIPVSHSQKWPMIDRVSAIINVAMVGAVAVMFSIFWGIKRPALFSRLRTLLTRLPVGALGLVLFFMGSYMVLAKTYDYHRGLLGLTDGTAILIGSFLCLWVFLLYEPQNPENEN